MAFDIDGDIGIGTVTPAGKLDLTASDPRFAIRNINDVGGGYIQQSGNALQLGLYNPSASGWGNVPANGFRAALGADNTGRVGSLTNTGLAPAFRNLLDDGNGNAAVQGRVEAANMPAIAHASTSIFVGPLTNNSGTLIENISINVPSSGFLHITCRTPIYYFRQGNDLGVMGAYLELKETTNGEVLTKEALFEDRGNIDPVGSNAMSLEMSLEHFMPVSAGPKSFKVRLRHAGGGGACYGEPGAQITIMYFPRGL
jgi:hypothetical protein